MNQKPTIPSPLKTTDYQFSDEESAKKAYEVANRIAEQVYFMQNLIVLEDTIVKVPDWFPFKLTHGKLIKP